MDQTSKPNLTDGRLLYRAAEAAELLGLSKQAVYQMAAEERLPSVRIGRCVRFRACDLERWVENLAAESDH